MPRYLLIPNDLENPDWEASTHKAPCRVTAPDEAAAREFANAAFRIATRRRNNERIVLSPWGNPERVKVRAQPPSGANELESFPPLIEVPDHENAKPTIDEWESLDDIADFDSGATWRVYPREEYLEQAVSYLREIGYEVNEAGVLSSGRQNTNNSANSDGPAYAKFAIHSIIAKPEQYQFLAQVLLDFLEGLEDRRFVSSGTNAHPIWGTVENTADLDELLREIRDELRRFNELLTQAHKDEPSLAESTGNLRSSIKGALAAVANSPFGKTVQVGLGGLFVAYLYQFGIKLGLSPLEPDVAAVVRHFVPGD